MKKVGAAIEDHIHSEDPARLTDNSQLLSTTKLSQPSNSTFSIDILFDNVGCVSRKKIIKRDVDSPFDL